MNQKDENLSKTPFEKSSFSEPVWFALIRKREANFRSHRQKMVGRAVPRLGGPSIGRIRTGQRSLHFSVLIFLLSVCGQARHLSPLSPSPPPSPPSLSPGRERAAISSCQRQNPSVPFICLAGRSFLSPPLMNVRWPFDLLYSLRQRLCVLGLLVCSCVARRDY